MPTAKSTATSCRRFRKEVELEYGNTRGDGCVAVCPCAARRIVSQQSDICSTHLHTFARGRSWRCDICRHNKPSETGRKTGTGEAAGTGECSSVARRAVGGQSCHHHIELAKLANQPRWARFLRGNLRGNRERWVQIERSCNASRSLRQTGTCIAPRTCGRTAAHHFPSCSQPHAPRRSEPHFPTARHAQQTCQFGAKQIWRTPTCVHSAGVVGSVGGGRGGG